MPVKVRDRESRPPMVLWIVLLIALAIRLAWGLTRPTDDASLDNLPDQRGV
jgi:hypothetical protein